MSKKQNNKIIIRGANVNNLKNIDVEIPKNKLVVITGISGSGKSSLAFDTIYIEGQRRYVESLSSYARQFINQQDKPDVDQITGLSPAIAIDQRTVSHNPRSTVGTLTEIYDLLRLLFARIGHPHCPECGLEIVKQSKEQILNKILSLGIGKEIMFLASIIKDKRGEHKKLLDEIRKANFNQVRIDKEFYSIEEAIDLEIDKAKPHTIDVMVSKMKIPEIKQVNHFLKSFNDCIDLGNGVIIVYETENKKEYLFSEHLSCPKCDFNLPEIEPRLFSFNSPKGACLHCSGLGVTQEIDSDLLIPNKKLTIAQGAIRPWVKMIGRGGSQQLMADLERVAEKNKFSIHAPVKNLTKKHLDIIYYGANGFVGVVPDLMKKYKETDSEFTRGEIEKYMRSSVCPKCEGQRLNKIALSVTVAGKNIAEVCEMTIGEAREFFSELG